LAVSVLKSHMGRLDGFFYIPDPVFSCQNGLFLEKEQPVAFRVNSCPWRHFQDFSRTPNSTSSTSKRKFPLVAVGFTSFNTYLLSFLAS